MSVTRDGRRPGREARGRLRATVAAIVAVLLSSVSLTMAAPAAAAPEDLNVTIDFLSGESPFAPITELQASTSDAGNGDKYNFRYNIAYTCGPVACDDVTIHIAPQPLDPTYGQYRFGFQNGVTLPPGATISGNANVGYTINLGTLASGTSGAFQMVYRYQTRGVGVDPMSFFPDGYVAQASATIDASNQDPVTSTDSLTWHIVTPDPRVRISAPVARVDVPYTYTDYMSASCQWERSTAGHGEPALLCAREYTVTQQLPAGVVFQSASNGGVYDADSNTVTWTQPSAPGVDPAVGWGPMNSLGRPHTVTVTFPQSMVPDPEECVLDVSSTLTVDMTYLDGAEKSATVTQPHVLNACEPFASAGLNWKATTRDAGSSANPIVWEGVQNHYWQVELYNRSNVPGVATVVDTELGQAGLRVDRIWTDHGPATFTYELDNGATGSVSDVNDWSAPAGRYIVSATVETGPIDGPNVQESSQPNTEYAYVRFYYDVETGVPIEGYTRSNTASATMSYPDTELEDVDLGSKSVTVTVTPRPALLSTSVSASVAGGGEPVAGTAVTYTNTASTSSVREDIEIEPVYVFVAPYQWEITSASFPPGVPHGLTVGPVTTVTIGGLPYQAVVARGTPGEVWGANETWPQLTVVATPTVLAPAGSSGRGTFYIGDENLNFNASNARWNYQRYVDAADLDGDTDITESFAYNFVDTRVGAQSGVVVRKEICQPDGLGGCAWLSDPATPVGVSPEAEDIQYRVTITNGSTPLGGVVLYDVLPHPGDVSLTTGAARGSDFAETLTAIADVTGSPVFAYSDSTNPCRPEVTPGGPADCDDDWSGAVGDATGASAIRVSLATLGAGASVSFTYTAAVEGSPVAGDLACNSVALDSSTTNPIEPAAVCARIEATDLRISVPNRLPLQEDRDGVLPFDVLNAGPMSEAEARVVVSVPEGLTVTDLDPAGWSCTAPGGPAPIDGPLALTCVPVDDLAQPRLLALGEVDQLDVPVRPSIVTGQLCVGAEVTGPLYDPELSNNTTNGCFAVLAWAPGVTISKDDGRTAVGVGDSYAYTVTVTNLLIAETVDGAVVTDALPDGLVFVSADNGGTVSDQNPVDAFGDQTGGTVTWNLGTLAAAGIPDSTGSTGSGSTGSSIALTVTVRVSPFASGDVINVAEVTAPDPADESADFTDDASDVDGLFVLDVTKTSDAPESGVRDGTVVTYTVTASNDGTAPYVGATIADDLSGVLDEGVFVAGSAELSINGGAPGAVDDPVGGLLTWTGTIPAGADAVLSYRIEVGAYDDGELVNTVGTSPEPTDCDAETGLDEDGLACAVLRIPFAPTFAKTVESLAQADDGSWTIVYGIDVVNPAPTGTGYDLADDLAFAPGITVESATVTPPASVTAETWTGSGDVALDADLPADTTHHYTITVTADAGTVAGTVAAECSAGFALGFANTAKLTLGDGVELDAEACAEPVEPTVIKKLDGEPVQGDDGRWTVTYLVTVTNDAEQPEDGLAYRLEDSLAFPEGLQVDEIQVTAPGGVTANAGFTGGLDEVAGAAVTPDPDLVDGTARIPAATGGTAAVQQYEVQLVVTAGDGSVDPSLVTCGPEGAGYGNWVTLLAGTTVLGQDTACADIHLPDLRFTKIADTSGGTRPDARVEYTIIVTNVGDADFTAGDPAEIVDDMSGLVDDARYLDDATADDGTVLAAPPGLAWTGELAAGDTVRITYSVVLGAIGSGDGAIVNQVRLAGLEEPGDDVVTCATTPEGNADAPICEVGFQLDTRALAMTGLLLPIAVLVTGALAAVVIGLMLAGRRRLGSG